VIGAEALVDVVHRGRHAVEACDVVWTDDGDAAEETSLERNLHGV